MLSRAERIKLLIDSSGKSYQELEKITGIKKSSLQRYASGVTTKIPLDVIETLSKTFFVSQKYLMGWSEDMRVSPDEAKLTEGEVQLLEVYRRASDEMKPILVNSIKALEQMPLEKLLIVAELLAK